MRAVCYSRVSSSSQRERDTIASQIRMLPEHVVRQGWQLVAAVNTYVDDGKSAQAGKLDKRTGLAALLRDARLGLFDVVVVVDIDRLTRSEDQAERGAIMGALASAGVKIATLSGAIHDLTTDEGDLHSALAGYFAASWGRKHKARIKAGKDTAISRGRKPAGPTPYGLSYSRATGLWSIDAAESEIMREIHRRITDGESTVMVADDFFARKVPAKNGGNWSRERVWALARAGHVTGVYVADKRRKLTIEVPAILTADEYKATQAALMAHAKRGLVRTKHIYLLDDSRGQCAQCGAAMAIRSATTNPRGNVSVAAYVCSNRKLAHRAANRCTAKIVHVADADARVWSALCREIEDPELLNALAASYASVGDEARDWAKDADGYRRHLARLDDVEAKLLARFTRGLISDDAMDAQLIELKKTRGALATNIETASEAARAKSTKRERIETAAELLTVLRSRLSDADLALRRELTHALIDKGGVVFDGESLRVTLLIPRPAVASKIDSVPATGYKNSHGDVLRLRVLA